MVTDSSTTVLPVPPEFASAEDLQTSYDLVFVTVRDLFSRDAPAATIITDVSDPALGGLATRKFTTLEPSSYGRGVTVMLLTAENLRLAASAADDTLSICVGIAHRTKVLRDVEKFSVGKNVKAVQQANATASRYVVEGFSCVAVNRPAAGKVITERVYWTPGAILPLAVVALKLPEVCQICFDSFAKHDGCRCANGHFLCWEGCFGGYVNSAAQAGSIQGFCDSEGNLLCPETKCKVPYDLQAVATAGAPPEVFAALTQLKMNVQADKKVQEALRAEEAKRKAEEARIAAITDLVEKEAHQLRMKIIDDILTLKCPRVTCRRAFHDFAGCFAVTCSCRAGFCAWCLADCGADAHAHVPRCPENPRQGDMFGSAVEFTAHHQQRRKRAIEALLVSKSVEVRRRVLTIMHVDLTELGIRIVMPVARAPPPQPAPPAAPVAPRFGFGWW